MARGLSCENFRVCCLGASPVHTAKTVVSAETANLLDPNFQF